MTIRLLGVSVVKRKQLHETPMVRAVRHLSADILGMIASVTWRSIDTDGASRFCVARAVCFELVPLAPNFPASSLQQQHNLVDLFVDLSSNVRYGTDPIAVHNSKRPPALHDLSHHSTGYQDSVAFVAV